MRIAGNGIARRGLIAQVFCAVIACTAMIGCTKHYTVDIRNNTPQPLHTGIYQETPAGGEYKVTSRLGPGDRTTLGPVIAAAGKTFVAADTRPNPGLPATLKLRKSVTYVEITQTNTSNEGRLEIREITD